jgi:hypothetical protein
MKKFKPNSTLFIFFVLIFLKQIFWSLSIPLWQTPDEQAHFAQVQNIAEKNIPGVLSTSKEIVDSEKMLDVFRNERGDNRFTYHPEYKIKYQANSYDGPFENKLKNIKPDDRKKLVKNEATWYPPLYYNFSATGYKLIYNGSIIDRVYFVRLWQSVIYLLMIIVYYLIAKEFFKSKTVIFSFLTFISFLPMPSFVASGVTSDNMMNLLFPTAIFLGTMIVKKGVRIPFLIYFLLIFALGHQTKPHFVISIPIFVFAIVSRKIYERKFKDLMIYIILSILFIIAVFNMRLYYFVTTGEIAEIVPDVGTSAVSLQKITLPGLINYFSTTLSKTYRETLPWFWGIFRWLSFALNRWYYRFFNLLIVISGVILAIRTITKIKSKKKIINENNLAEFFLYSSVVIYFIVLTLWDYLFFLSHNFSLGMQGRYYFPVLFPIIFFIFKNISVLLKKEVFIKMFGITMIILNFYALFEIAKSYYDFNSLKTFLFEFGQYKPEFLKGAAIVAIMGIYLVTLSIFIIRLINTKNESIKN